MLTIVQTLYIYLGIAALLGLAAGLIHHYVHRWLQGAMGLDGVSQSPRGRTAREYRMTKRRQKMEDSAPVMSPGVQLPVVATSSNGAPKDYHSLSESSHGKARVGRSLLAQTIMEEADPDY